LVVYQGIPAALGIWKGIDLMCGVIAAFNYQDARPAADETLFDLARDKMQSRGPDGAGDWRSDDGRIVLGHRRLAIIDVGAGGRQPMQLRDTPIWIIFNGEIYNFRELRRRLEVSGARFRTNSDTEVILNLYEQKGPKGIELLRGMFAFVIWDGRDRSVLLSRDPFGIKPLYYLDDGRRLLVASQTRAIRSMCKELAPDPVGHLGFFLNGYVPDPFTMFKGIRALPAGCWLRRSESQSELQRYFSIPKVVGEGAAGARDEISDNERNARIADSLKSSVRAHMVADVDVGLFLSAGVDSAAIGWLAAQQASDRLRAMTLGACLYKGGQNDEIPSAGETAEVIGLNHKTGYLSERDFTDQIHRIIDAMDQPSIDGVNTYFVSKIASEAGLKVVLSGLGGDELFNGYPSFRHVPNIVRLNRLLSLLPSAGRVLRAAVAPFTGQVISPKYASLLEYGRSYSEAYFLRRALYMPWELRAADSPGVLSAAFEEFSGETLSDAAIADLPPEAQVAALEMTHYMRDQLLRDSDWAGMASSLEIRVPFVDSMLLSELAPLLFSRRGIQKRDMLVAISHPMTDTIASRPKTGFDMPIHEWLLSSTASAERGLRGWARHVYAHWCASNNCPMIIDVEKA
jgi:asparagine synthase (glutamine-hydrolysing)